MVNQSYFDENKSEKKRADESSTLPEAFVYLFLRKGPWEKGLKKETGSLSSHLLLLFLFLGK